MNKQELLNLINSVEKPLHWRKGQFIFNRVEKLFGNIAREVQFIDRVDCFYDDNKIDEFLTKVINRM